MTGLLESAVRKLSFVWTHDRSVRSFSRLRKSPAGLAFKATEKLDPDVSELLSTHCSWCVLDCGEAHCSSTRCEGRCIIADLEHTRLFHDGSGAIESVLPASSSATAILTVSAICQKRNDSVVGQRADLQWTRYRRCPTAFPSPIARWRNLPRVAASLKLPACPRPLPPGAARPQNQSAGCSTAIGNFPFPIQ